MPEEQKFDIRDLRDGNSYWIDRSILHSYGQKLKASGVAVYNALVHLPISRPRPAFLLRRL